MRPPHVPARERLAAFDAKGRDARFAAYVARFDEIDAAHRACLATEAEAEAVMAIVAAMSPRPARRTRATTR